MDQKNCKAQLLAQTRALQVIKCLEGVAIIGGDGCVTEIEQLNIQTNLSILIIIQEFRLNIHLFRSAINFPSVPPDHTHQDQSQVILAITSLSQMIPRISLSAQWTPENSSTAFRAGRQRSRLNFKFKRFGCTVSIVYRVLFSSSMPSRLATDFGPFLKSPVHTTPKINPIACPIYAPTTIVIGHFSNQTCKFLGGNLPISIPI